jgi:hypothetical protein
MAYHHPECPRRQWYFYEGGKNQQEDIFLDCSWTGGNEKDVRHEYGWFLRTCKAHDSLPCWDHSLEKGLLLARRSAPFTLISIRTSAERTCSPSEDHLQADVLVANRARICGQRDLQ